MSRRPMAGNLVSPGEERPLFMLRSIRNSLKAPMLMQMAVCEIAASASFATAQEYEREARYFDETAATTLFAFDDVSIPFSQNLKLQMRAPKRHPANPVLRRGATGKSDSWAVQFYGSVIRIGGKYRMWYVAVGDERLEGKMPRSSPWRAAYAESDDGIHWEKPSLGLVDYRGSRQNNLVQMQPRLGTVNVKVLFDPDDPDPNRRFKMGAHVWWPKNEVRLGTLATYGSPDGFSWKLLTKAQPVDQELPPAALQLPPLHFEPVGGLYKWDGLYYLSGQNAMAAARPYHGRVVREYVSPDFVNWSQVSAIGFVRPQQHTLLGPGRSREGEQNHEAVSVWNRKNVLVGVSGIWHGAKDWKEVTVDLGLVVSNDGVKFRQPSYEWTFLKRGDDGTWDQGGLLQGQGFANVGEQTFIYYGAWDPRNWQNSPPRGGVGIATLPRDRFADLVVDESTEGAGNYQMPRTTSSFMTAPIDLNRGAKNQFYVNADGLGPEAALKFELLEANTIPIAAFCAKNAAAVRENGYQTPVAWPKEIVGTELPERVRLRVTFLGKRKSNIRFSAVYMR